MKLVQKRITAALAFAACSLATPAEATSLSTDVEVKLPSRIALYCYDRVHVNITPDAYLTARGFQPPQNGGTLSTDANASIGVWAVEAPANQFRSPSLTNRINLNMTGVCALRAVTDGAGVRVQIDALETSLVTPTGASIDIRRARARDGGYGGGWRRRYTLNNGDLGPSSLRDIDVRLQLDVRNATEAGTYSSLSDGTFLVTITARP